MFLERLVVAVVALPHRRGCRSTVLHQSTSAEPARSPRQLSPPTSWNVLPGTRAYRMFRMSSIHSHFGAFTAKTAAQPAPKISAVRTAT